MSERIAFRMVLHEGQAKAYRERHAAIFPDLVEALKAAGISDYSIWLDPETHHLFAILTRRRDHDMDALPQTEIVQRWWAFMADIMETDPGNVPRQVQLLPMFHLP
ncbi:MULTISPECIES: L-rhamnose mutarotase [unclassified Aureimonas]|uniref:L-rhamnose mutarotase n=1 Tax=unclassified Aureimonas TaxID=2615206 RepID=UPI0006F799E0|nr:MULTISPECIES: L-rhamnose mutarotase [unclassified Aureimonas]KQT64462.1 L-rhamnose mutarotase [Aureimonas sp. Leaf427]KQT81650.1 L-rhamnose mutarotase [Aureimonas sp. Leaf460]